MEVEAGEEDGNGFVVEYENSAKKAVEKIARDGWFFKRLCFCDDDDTI